MLHFTGVFHISVVLMKVLPDGPLTWTLQPGRTWFLFDQKSIDSLREERELSELKKVFLWSIWVALFHLDIFQTSTVGSYWNELKNLLMSVIVPNPPGDHSSNVLYMSKIRSILQRDIHEFKYSCKVFAFWYRWNNRNFNFLISQSIPRHLEKMWLFCNFLIYWAHSNSTRVEVMVKYSLMLPLTRGRGGSFGCI